MPTRMFSFRKINTDLESDVTAFVNFSLSLYGKTPKTKNSLNKTRSLIAAGKGYAFYLVTEGEKILGRMAIGTHASIRDESGSPYGQIGLFEVVENYDVFKSMIDFAKKTLEGASNFLFPFYISTWHQYRFMSQGFDGFEFFLETENKDYYADFSKKYGVDKIHTYKSVLEMNFDGFIKKQEKAYRKATKEGITFRSLNKKDLMNEIKIIYDLSIQGFKGNHFYTEITFDQFLGLYLDSIKYLDPDFFIFAYAGNNKPVGYIFSTPDYTYLFNKINVYSLFGKIKFLLFRNRAEGYIVKSTMVLPEYRNKSIFGGLTYVNGMKAKERKFKYLIGALAYTDNISITVITPERKEKEYELYEISTGVK